MANRLSSGMLPFEYLPLSTPDARGLQIVVPAPDAMYKLSTHAILGMLTEQMAQQTTAQNSITV